MNFSKEQIKTLEEALRIVFDGTANEFVRPKIRTQPSAPKEDGGLGDALVQFLCEDAYATEPDTIIELLGSQEGSPQ